MLSHLPQETWFTAIAIPILAVLLGSILTILFNFMTKRSEEKSTRGKVLQLMQLELKRILETSKESGLYPALEFRTGAILLSNTAFSIKFHSNLINLCFDLQTQFERFELALKAMPSLIGPLLGTVNNPSFLNTLSYSFSINRGQDPKTKKVSDELSNRIKILITENMTIISPIAQQLLTEVEQTLKSRNYIIKKHKS